MSLDCDVETFLVDISNSGSGGQLVLDIPKSMLDPTAINQYDRFIVLVDGEEVDYEETLNPEYRQLVISYLSDAHQIEIIQAWIPEGPKPEACKIIHNPPYSYILPPLKQLESVNDIHEIVCKDGKQLVFKKKYLVSCMCKT